MGVLRAVNSHRACRVIAIVGRGAWDVDFRPGKVADVAAVSLSDCIRKRIISLTTIGFCMIENDR